MKKIILGITFTVAMGMLPLLSSADTPSCDITAPDFCSCFAQASIAGCKQRLPAPTCLANRVQQQMASIGASATCGNYKPPGIDQNVCVADVTFFINNCSCNTSTCTAK